MLKNIVFSSLIIVLLMLASCKADEPFEPIERSRTSLNLLNAYGPVNKVDIFLRSFESNGLFASNVNFMESWPKGGYASLITTSGFDSLEKEPDTYLRVVERSSAKEIISEQGFRLNPDVRSTVVLIDSIGKAKLVKTIDIFEAPGDTAANVRFMNVNYTMTSVSLRSSDSTLLIDRLNFLNYSSFTKMPPGTYDFEFISDQTRTIVSTLKDVNIEKGNTYNFFLTQLGGAPRAGVERLE
jgi:hypothetical protein